MHTAHADNLIDVILSNQWNLEWVIETHVHADHLSAAPYLANHLGAKIGIGSNINAVQKLFGKVFNAGTLFELDGSQFDRLYQDGVKKCQRHRTVAVLDQDTRLRKKR